MTEDVKKILEMFADKAVLAVLEAEDRYIVSICNSVEDIDSATECFIAIDKKTFKTSEYSYFNNRDEYIEACNNVLYKYEELTHWGIKGMKWGVRRYQNKDGSLTDVGKKKLRAETAKVRQEEKVLKNRKAVKEKVDKLEARRKAVEEGKKELDGENAKGGRKGKKSSSGDEANKKSIKDMSDEELYRAIQRARLEDEYRKYTPEPPEKQSAMKRVKDEVVVPAALNAGKRFAENAINKIGDRVLNGKGEVDSVEVLRKSYEKLDLEQKIDKIKNRDKYMSEDDQTKRQERLFRAQDREAQMEGYDNAVDRATKQRASAEAARKASADAAARKASADAAARKASADAAARKANEAKSQEYYNSTYHYVNTGKTKATSSVKNLPAVVSDIPSKTVNSGKSTASGLIEQSSTRSKSEARQIVYDRDGRPILYMSGIRGDSDVII